MSNCYHILSKQFKEHHEMNLVNLPDEILLIIFKHLDIRSLYCLYTACVRVQNIIRTYGAIKTCNLSLSNMAKAETLNLTFFKDISRNLKELNLCGVSNLTKVRVLLPAIRRFQCLDTLDVTYTKITITDFIEVYRLCPTITNLSINFSFDKLPQSSIEEPTLQPYQQVFSNLLNVHFVGSLYNLLFIQLPCFILKRAKIMKLQYTIIDDNNVTYNLAQSRENVLNFDNFTINFSNTMIRSTGAEVLYSNNQVHGCLNEMVPFDVLDFPSYEILVTNFIKKGSAKAIYYATPIFENFFRMYNNLSLYENIDLRIVNDFEVELDGNVCVMLWKKSETQFDHKFFSSLWYKLKPLFPCYFDSSSNAPVPADYDLYVTFPREIEYKTEIVQGGSKRKRLVPTNCVLNYDSAFQEKSRLQLALKFDGNIRSAVSLSTSCDYLKKITFLSLSGQIRYSSDFFNVLFRCCHNLVTLRVQGNSFGSCSSAITRSLPLSQSIKNIHLTDRNIDFPTLFSSMSQCKTLENIHIVDTSFSTNYIDASVVFEKCVNLYCLYLYIYSSFNSKKKFMKTFRRAKQNQINVKIFSNNHIICDPYSNMYCLNLLR